MPSLLSLSAASSTTKRGTSAARSRQGGRSSSSPSFLSVMVLCGLCGGVLGFYAGLLVASSSSSSSSNSATATADSTEHIIQARVQKEVQRQLQQHHLQQQPQNGGAADDTAPRFPDAVQDFAAGLATVDRDDFMTAFDVGVPRDPSVAHRNSAVLMLYQSPAAIPDANAFVQAEIGHSTTPLPHLQSAREATQNCDFLNIMLTDHSGGNRRRQCTAIVGQYEAFHLQKFMRLPVEKGPLDPALPLRYVNRGAQASGRLSTQPATREDTVQYWARLQTYLATLDSVLDELKPLLQQVAIHNTVTVLVCNYGQSELLLNFVCGARHHRGLDLNHILVFATDLETRDLLRAAGVAVFYDETNYGDSPKQAAGRYADKTFMVCVFVCV